MANRDGSRDDNRNDNRNDRRSKPIRFEIREHIGTVSVRSSGWTKELNLVSWNGAEPPKFDIRDWSPDHHKMSKGVTLYGNELKIITRLFDDYRLNRAVPAEYPPRRRKQDKFFAEDAEEFEEGSGEAIAKGAPAASSESGSSEHVEAAWSEPGAPASSSESGASFDELEGEVPFESAAGRSGTGVPAETDAARAEAYAEPKAAESEPARAGNGAPAETGSADLMDLAAAAADAARAAAETQGAGA